MAPVVCFCKSKSQHDVAADCGCSLGSQLVKISRGFLTLDGHPSPSLKNTVACGLPALDCRRWDGVDAPDPVPENPAPRDQWAKQWAMLQPNRQLISIAMC